MRRLAALFASLLAGCALGIPDAWEPPPPPEPCVPIIVDGVQNQCVPRSKFPDWMERNLGTKP